VVRAGNAGVVRVIVNGQDRGRMGSVGQVVVLRYGE
jgi:cytoskeleton protein RodZ